MQSKLKLVRDELVKVALLQEELLGKRSDVTGSVGEIDTALLLGLTDVEFKACNSGTPNTPGYDLVHAGRRIQVKALRDSPTNKTPVKFTTQIRNPNYDVLVLLVYETDFSIRDLYVLTKEQADASFHLSGNRIRFNKIPHFRVDAVAPITLA